jgi:glutaredoxin
MYVVVYTRASCEDCMATLALLTELQIPFRAHPEEEILPDLLTPEEKAARVNELIFRDSMPQLTLPKVVTPYGDWWSGHQPDSIRELAADMAEELAAHERARQKRARTHHLQLVAA